MTAPLLMASGVVVTRGGRAVLAGVDVAVGAGESVAFTGPSGSGKSTLLAVLARIEAPDAGTVVLGLPASDVGLVLQGHGLVSLLTAEENVALPLQTPGRPALPRSVVRARAHTALEEVGLADVADHLVEALSGGQQQRVAIARALVTGPALLIADEPTAALDAENRERVVDLLLRLAERGAALVIATHDLAIAARTDRTLRVVDGRVVAD